MDGKLGDHVAYRTELTVEFWDRDHPYKDAVPRVNFTADDHQYGVSGWAGLRYEQAIELRDLLTRWIDANA